MNNTRSKSVTHAPQKRTTTRKRIGMGDPFEIIILKPRKPRKVNSIETGSASGDCVGEASTNGTGASKRIQNFMYHNNADPLHYFATSAFKTFKMIPPIEPMNLSEDID